MEKEKFLKTIDIWSGISLTNSFISYKETPLPPQQRKKFYLWALNYLNELKGYKYNRNKVCICNLLIKYRKKLNKHTPNRTKFCIYNFPELVQQRTGNFYWFDLMSSPKTSRIHVLVNALEILEEYN
jgi:hypothetical protein